MKSIITSSSEISSFGRMDPGFFIAKNKVAIKAEEFKSKYSKDEVVKILECLQTSELAALQPLLTSQQTITDRRALSVAIEKYPYIALGLVQSNIDFSIKKVERAREMVENQKNNLLRIKTF